MLGRLLSEAWIDWCREKPRYVEEATADLKKWRGKVRNLATALHNKRDMIAKHSGKKDKKSIALMRGAMASSAQLAREYSKALEVVNVTAERLNDLLDDVDGRDWKIGCLESVLESHMQGAGRGIRYLPMVNLVPDDWPRPEFEEHRAEDDEERKIDDYILIERVPAGWHTIKQCHFARGECCRMECLWTDQGVRIIAAGSVGPVGGSMDDGGIYPWTIEGVPEKEGSAHATWREQANRKHIEYYLGLIAGMDEDPITCFHNVFRRCGEYYRCSREKAEELLQQTIDVCARDVIYMQSRGVKAFDESLPILLDFCREDHTALINAILGRMPEKD